MRNLTLLLAAIFFQFQLFAQSIVLKGMVQNQHQEGVPFATIKITGNADENFDKLANEAGFFEVELNKKKNYQIRISAVGYVDTTLQIVQASPQTVKITMKELSNVLESVNVVSKIKKPLIERKIDRVVMNVGENALSTGKSSLELIDLAPGVFVNQGSISINGVSGARVMVNGKLLRFTGLDLKNYLQSLRAIDIESVEVIPNPPAEYEAEGSGGLVNIILKKTANKGLNASIGSEFSQGLGKYPGYNPNISLNYNTNKIQINTNANYSQNKFFQNIGQQRMLKNKGLYEARNNFLGNERVFSLRAGVNYDISEQQNLGFEYAFSNYYEKDTTQSFSTILFPNNSDQNSSSNGFFPITNKQLNHNYTLNYTLKTDDKGSKIIFLFDYTFRDGKNSSGTFSKTFDHDNKEVGDTTFNFYSPSEAKILTSNLQYDFNILKEMAFSLGGKGTFTTINNHNYYDIFENKLWSRPNDLSFDYTYKERILAGFVNVSGNFRSYQYKLGLRGENSNIEGLLTGSQSAFFPRKYFNWFPNVNIKKLLDSTGGSSISFNYNRRLNRPAYFDLNPFQYYIDNYTIQTGNPYLNPSFTSKYSVNYIFKSNYFVEFSYSHAKDIINQVIENDPEKEILILLNKNSGTSSVWTVTFSIPQKITKWWKSNNNLLLIQTKNEAPEFLINNSNLILETHNEINLGRQWQANIGAFYTPNIVEANVVLDDLASVDVSIQKKFLNNRLSTSFVISDVFYTNKVNAKSYYKGQTMLISNFRQTRRAVLTLTYDFKQGKDFRIKTIKNGNEEEKNRL